VHRLCLGIAQLTRFFPCPSVAGSALLDGKPSRRPPLHIAGMASRSNHRRLLRLYSWWRGEPNSAGSAAGNLTGGELRWGSAAPLLRVADRRGQVNPGAQLPVPRVP
jgi:hypothetical protein